MAVILLVCAYMKQFTDKNHNVLYKKKNVIITVNNDYLHTWLDEPSVTVETESIWPYYWDTQRQIKICCHYIRTRLGLGIDTFAK